MSLNQDPVAALASLALIALLGARWAVHYLTCNCPNSRRGRAHTDR